jgi:hypothetical protein
MSEECKDNKQGTVSEGKKYSTINVYARLSLLSYLSISGNVKTLNQFSD